MFCPPVCWEKKEQRKNKLQELEKIIINIFSDKRRERMEHFGTIGRILGLFTVLSVFQIYNGPGTNVEVHKLKVFSSSFNTK